MTRAIRHIRELLVALAFTLGVGGCADGTAPLSEGPSFARGGPRWFESATTDSDESSTSDLSDVESDDMGDDDLFTLVVPEGTVSQSALAPPLEGHHVSFSAVQGRRTNHTVYYTTGSVFLYLEIPSSAQLVDETGRRLERGERVNIQIDIDPESFAVRFSPHGITFPRHPAGLTFGLQYADWTGREWNEGQYFKLFYQPSADVDWNLLDTEIDFDIAGLWAWAPLDHFSNYAIAW